MSAEERVIRMPSRLDNVTNVLGLNLPKQRLVKGSRCVLDFTSCVFGEPLPMLLAAREYHHLKRSNPNVDFYCRTNSSAFRGYADHIGFFRHMGFSRGNRPGAAAGSSNYIPIQVIDLNEWRSASADRPYAEIVEEKTFELAEVLTQATHGGVFVALQYSMREIIRNAIEHSQSQVLVLFGQYWPTKHIAEIVIYDVGVGVHNTLVDSGEHKVDRDADALLLAIKPGITGVSERERSFQHEGWQNSGFGLYVTSRFCSENGVFRMISGTRGVTRNSRGIVIHEWAFGGTCIQMKIRTNNIENSGPRILEIVAEGEAEIGTESKRPLASRSSKSVFGADF